MQIIPANEFLTREERKMLTRKKYLPAWLGILEHYAWIVGAFALVYYFPNPLTVVVALFILGGKQLACAILMHDTSHHAVFPNKKMNDLVGQVLGAWPIFNNMFPYRAYHFRHHISNGLDDDPDLLLTRGYPTSRKSMARKFFRDLTGQTGIKALFGLILIHLGYLEYNLGGQVVRIPQAGRPLSDRVRAFCQNLLGPLLTQGVLIGLLAWFASPWLYLLWIGAYLTTFQFSLRVRSMSEHSVVDDQRDPWRNTRTTLANGLERLLFAPYHVNYHCEHHMLMSVPPYHLPKMHAILRARKFYDKALLAPGYWSVIKKAVRPAE